MDTLTPPLTAKARTEAQTGMSAADVFGACLRLVRPANLVTAAADVLAGWIVVGGSRGALGWRVAASVSLYAGGVVLNDFFDRNLDTVERPERPIPSGKVPAASAAALGIILLCAGIASAFQASTITGIIATATKSADASSACCRIQRMQWSRTCLRYRRVQRGRK